MLLLCINNLTPKACKMFPFNCLHKCLKPQPLTKCKFCPSSSGHRVVQELLFEQMDALLGAQYAVQDMALVISEVSTTFMVVNQYNVYCVCDGDTALLDKSRCIYCSGSLKCIVF